MIFLSSVVIATAMEGQAKLWLGMIAGGTVAAYIALRDSPPWHIEKWRKGSQGERRTAKALRQLERKGWHVYHDLGGRNGTNIDHVAVGPAGVFLFDSKNYFGEARVDGGELRIRRIDDPDDSWTCRGIVPRMRGASAGLKERIESATGIRVWVQPVVVLWCRFPAGAVRVSGIEVVHGDLLAGWLSNRGPVRPFNADVVKAFLQAAPSA